MPNNELHRPNGHETDLYSFAGYQINFEELERERTLHDKEHTLRAEALVTKLESLSWPNKVAIPWNRITEKVVDVDKTIRLDNIATDDTDNPPRAIQYLFLATKNLLLHQMTKERKAMAEQHARSEAYESYESFAEYEQFRCAGEINYKIGPLSIEDLASNRKLPASAIFSTFMASLPKNLTISDTKFSYQNPLAELYPNMERVNYRNAQLEILSLFQLSTMSPQNLERPDILQGNPKIAVEIIKKAKEITAQLRRHTETMSETLFDPNSSDFMLLKEQVEKWLLNNNAPVAISFLKTSGLIKDIQNNYRKAKKLAVANINNSSNFYDLLTKSLLEYVQSDIAQEEYLTTDDIPTILNTDEMIPIDAPSIEDLKEQANGIFRRSRKPQYIVDLETLALKNLFAPKTIQVDFPYQNSRLIKFEVFYENDNGESLKLKVDFDTKKNAIDWWSFMEDPDDPSMLDMKKVIMHASFDTLKHVSQQLEDEHKQTSSIKPSKTPEPIKARPKPEYIPREKVERTDEQQLSKMPTLVEQLLQSSITGKTSPEAPKVQNKILLPDEGELKSMMRGISVPDQDKIIQRIRIYNDLGLGVFKMLTILRTTEGEKLYTLKVNGPNGGSRVLLEEIKLEDAPQNTRTFKITDIGYRKDIYRKL